MGFVWIEEKENDEKFEKHVEELTKTMTKTNKDLLDEVKKLKEKLKEFDGITVIEYNKIKNELETLKKQAGNDDSELAKQVRVLSEQLEQTRKESKERIDLLDNHNKKLLVDDEINKSLIEYKVKPSMLKAARRIIKADVSVIDDNGTRKAIIGDKTINDFVKEWVETDEGKNFILAPDNHGGDSTGNNKTNYKESDFEKYFDKKSPHWNRTKQAQLKKSNFDLWDKLSKKHNK